MKLTARTLIYDAHRALGVLRSGQGPNDDSVDDAFRALNDMIDSWALESLMVYGIEATTYPVTAGTGSYTLGPGGTLGTTRPVRVEGAGFTTSTCPDSAIAVLSLDEYRRNRAGVYIDSAYPAANVRLNPVPINDAQLTLYTWTIVKQFTSLDTPYDLPPGYAKALRWNLAVEIAPYVSYAKKIPDVLYASIERHAIESKAAIKSFHSSPPPIADTSDAGALGCGCSYDVYTDSYH
jgi:hypothetical protein